MGVTRRSIDGSPRFTPPRPSPSRGGGSGPIFKLTHDPKPGGVCPAGAIDYKPQTKENERPKGPRGQDDMGKNERTDVTAGAGVNRPEARLVKGFRDIEAAELRRLEGMIAKIRAVYERYGFEPLETPAFEYTDALGKFLPDQDRPNAGVFSLQDEAEEWMSLRYDLTAPLARYVAQNFERLPKPYRRYAYGSVYRNEKPGPGRYRQFTSSTPIRWGPTTSRRMPRCACWRPIRWRRWGSSGGSMLLRSIAGRCWTG